MFRQAGRFVGLICLLSVLAGCGGGGDGSTSADTFSTQTFAGYYAQGTTDTPCYWQVAPSGSARTDLTVPNGTTYAQASSPAFTSSGTVYVAGSYQNGNTTTPCYWAGTARTDLPIPNSSGYAYSIAIDSGTVYVAGNYYNGKTNIPCYWKVDNTGVATRTALSIPKGSTYATSVSIVVNNGTIYIAGFSTNGSSTPCFWKVDTTGAVRTDLLAQNVGGYA